MLAYIGPLKVDAVTNAEKTDTAVNPATYSPASNLKASESLQHKLLHERKVIQYKRNIARY